MKFLANVIQILKYFLWKLKIRTPKTWLFEAVTKPPVQTSLFKTDFKEIMSKVSPSNKYLFLAGDNIDSLDYLTNSIVKQFFNLSFKNGVTPLSLLINRPTRVSRTSATCIDQMLTNIFMDSKIMSGIIKTDIIDHFAIFCTIKTNEKYPPMTSRLSKEIWMKTISDSKYLVKIVASKDVLSTGTYQSQEQAKTP